MSAVRNICVERNKKILFTTHSLAIMKTIYEYGTPIIYLKNENGVVNYNLVSYSFIQFEMFVFQGFDKYIFTEDVTVENYINLKLSTIETKNRVKVIYIGGCSNVVDLMKRNARTGFICSSQNAIAVLDGDAKQKYGHRADVIISPYHDIEDEIFRKYKEENAVYKLPDVAPDNAKPKACWKKLQERREDYNLTQEDIFTILERGFDAQLSVFYNELNSFVNGCTHNYQ